MIIVLYKILRKVILFFGVPLHFSSDGEDYVLQKIFSKLKNGYYIDIGSHHPILHSNTFLFYLNGWRGVCVDPLPNLIKKYKIFRGEDTFIPAGFASKNSDLRVVDAASMPYVTNGNIYAPVMMLAEKAADLILEKTPLAPEEVPYFKAKS